MVAHVGRIALWDGGERCLLVGGVIVAELRMVIVGSGRGGMIHGGSMLMLGSHLGMHSRMLVVLALMVLNHLGVMVVLLVVRVIVGTVMIRTVVVVMWQLVIVHVDH